MADRPIIFSGPMVQALLASRKTQTRRVLKPQPDTLNGGTIWSGAPFGPLAYNGTWLDGARSIQSLPYAPGDRLYVREAVCWVSAWGWRYRADNDELTDKREAGEVSRWRPSIHMPRWASRLTLFVTDVRVQRLQDISEADAVAEGITALPNSNGPNFYTRGIWRHGLAIASHNTPTAVGCFRGLWEDIHGLEAWEENPWVVALTFTVHRGNIDTIGVL